MAHLQRITTTIIAPALAALAPRMDSPEARVLLLAIGLQESRFEHRFQVVKGKPGAKGPARGYWQFERAGGVAGVLTHPVTHRLAVECCEQQGVIPSPRSAWIAIETNDILACQFARLLLLADPKPLPRLGRGGEAWAYYLNGWRPGKPHVGTWNGIYAQAFAAVTE